MSTASSTPFRPVIAGLLEQDVLRANGTVPASELTIRGNGYFIVRDPETGEKFATQTSHFSLGAKGYLLTDTGARLQGRMGGPTSRIGDIRVTAADAAMLCYSVDRWGRILVYLTDGTSYLRGQILLQNFSEAEALIGEGNELHSNLAAAGPLPAMAAPGTHGLGMIQADLPQICHGEPVWTN